MRFKVDIFSQKFKDIDYPEADEEGNYEGATKIGEAQFIIGELFQNKKEGLCKDLFNCDEPRVERRLRLAGTTCTMRYEQIEQTNTMVTMQVMVKGFQQAYLIYKIMIVREMNDYVLVY